MPNIKAAAKRPFASLKARAQKIKDTVDLPGLVQGGKDSLDAFRNRKTNPVDLSPRPPKGQSYDYAPAGRPPLFVDGVSAQDIKQEQLGDCVFLAAAASLAHQHPDKLKNKLRENADGTYTVTFYETPASAQLKKGGWAGNWATSALSGADPSKRKPIEVTVDGNFPTDKTHAPGDGKKDHWPAVLEKAYAKLYGGYGNIEEAGYGAALLALTGGKIDRLNVGKEKGDALWKKLTFAVANKDVLLATTSAGPKKEGLSSQHAYSVLGTKVVNGKKYVELFNPWATHEPKGDGKNDGRFLLSFDDFRKNMATVHRASVS